MQKYVKNEKQYRLINFICLLAVYKKLIGTGRVLGTSILRYASNFKAAQFSFEKKETGLVLSHNALLTIT